MTIPTQMNCAHLDDGWCLTCVMGLEDERQDLAARVKELEGQLKATERQSLDHWNSFVSSEGSRVAAEARAFRAEADAAAHELRLRMPCLQPIDDENGGASCKCCSYRQLSRTDVAAPFTGAALLEAVEKAHEALVDSRSMIHDTAATRQEEALAALQPYVSASPLKKGRK